MAKSCIHTVNVINCLRRPEPAQNMPYLPPYQGPIPNSSKFRENIEILRIQANSAALLKILRSLENCGP